MTAPPEQRDFEKEAIGRISQEAGFDNRDLERFVENIDSEFPRREYKVAALLVRYCAKWLEAEGLIRQRRQWCCGDIVDACSECREVDEFLARRAK